MSDDENPRIILTLDGDAISVKNISWLSGEDIGCLALRTDGSHFAYCEKANPTEAEFYKIGSLPTGISFEEKKRLVMRAIGIPDGVDELPWTDDLANDVPIVTEREQLLLNNWLEKEITFEDDRLHSWGDRTASQYTPGFEIMSALSENDRTTLGLHEVDLGGPASSVPAVVMKATIEEFNYLMKKNGLPYLMVDNDGPIELSTSEE